HLVDEAKKHLRDGTATWRRHWQRASSRAEARAARAEARASRREWHRERREMRDHMRWGPPPISPEHTSYATRVLMGVLIPLAALCNAVLIIAFIVVMAQLFTHGTVFGWQPPPEIPLWADALILFVVLHICAAPLRAVRHVGYYTHGAGANVWFALWGSILWVGFVIVFFWLAYHYWPDVSQ